MELKGMMNYPNLLVNYARSWVIIEPKLDLFLVGL